MLRKRVWLEQFEPLSILVSWYSVWNNVNLYYERPAARGTTQGVRTQGGVIPATMSYSHPLIT